MGDPVTPARSPGDRPDPAELKVALAKAYGLRI